jgi:hypothetical protein
MVWVKLLCKAAGWTWYVIEVQELHTDAIFYVYAVGWDDELTYINRSDMELLAAQAGTHVEHDPAFTPCRLSEVVVHERGDGPNFSLGQVVATPSAIETLERNQQSPITFVRRHGKGDWGELDAHDVVENEYALTHGLRLLSAYTLRDGTRIWIITEADRSATTILLPAEY